MKRLIVASAAGLLVLAAGFAIQAQEAEQSGELPVSDPVCTFFGPDHDEFVAALGDAGAASHLTEDVVAKLPPVTRFAAALPSAPGGSRTDALQNPALPTIDKYIFEKLAQDNVAPAPMAAPSLAMTGVVRLFAPVKVSAPWTVSAASVFG